MDPAGIREILLVRPYIYNPYQFEAVARGLPYKTRIRPHYSSIPWLPLFEPLTQRVSALSEGYAGYGQYDCMILAGTDLESCTERDIQHMRSAFERGLPVLVCGGFCGLGRSYRLWHDLDDCLPAHVPAGEPAECKGEVVTASGHAIQCGLPESFGSATKVNTVEPAEDTQIILSANGKPVLLASEKFGGRQLMLTVAEAGGLCCDGLDTSGFYGHPFYADLMRQALSWLMGTKTPLRFESLRMETGLRLDKPGEHVIQLTARRDEEVEGGLVRCAVYGVDEARLMSGGDAVADELVHEEIRELGEREQQEVFKLEDPMPGLNSGLYEVVLTAEMNDPPLTRPSGTFAMAAPPAWSNWKGNAVDLRRFWLRFPDQRKTKVTVPGWSCTIQEGQDWQAQVEPQGGIGATFRVTDERGEQVGESAGQPSGQQDLVWKVPALQEGDYRAVVEVADDAHKEEFRFLLKFVDPPDPDGSLQLVGHFRGDTAGDEELVERIRTCLESFGLDALSYGGMSHARDLYDESLPRLEQPRELRRLRWMDAVVASRRQNLWTDFDASMIVLATHGASKSYDPTEPCVHHPDYEAAVRDKLAPALRLQASRAGLISTEIIDEPHLYPSNICRCAICKRLYHETYNEEIPTWEEINGDQTSRRWHLFQWLEDYSTRAFAAIRKIKGETAPGTRLHNVAIDRLFSSNFMFNGIHRWAEFGDEIYMACYPWSYLNYRGRNQVPHSQTHWIAAWIRGLAAHYDIHWGVFMEIWEHDVPNRWMPPYWSVGQFYALLAAGVTRLDTFILSFGFECFGISDKRLREFGFEVNKVRPFFPLLAQTRRPRARMAFVNPWCQWVMEPQPHYLPPDHEGYGYYRRYAFPIDKLYPNENRRMLAFELFHRTFSDLDQVDEQLLCEAPMDYGAIIICDCNFLMRQTMEELESFVEKGGALVLDCEPRRDESGQETDYYQRLTSGSTGETGVIVPGLGYERFQFGEGSVLCFTSSLQTSYADALESERLGIRERLEQTISRLLRGIGLTPRWQTDCGDLDAGLRLADNTCLVPVANLCPDHRSGRITLSELPFVPVFAANLTDGSFIEFSPRDDEVVFDVSLDGYHGTLFGFFASRPERCVVCLGQQNLRPGDTLHYDVSLESGEGSKALGTFMVEATVTDSSGSVHHRLGGPIIVRGGIAGFEKRLPVNAVPGKWSVTVSDPLTGLSAEEEFDVHPRADA